MDRAAFPGGGKTISDKLAGYLIFLTGGGMRRSSRAKSKISSYASGEEIQRSDIDAVVTPVLNAQTFDISNAIAGGNFKLALTKLQELFAMQAEPIAILGAVGSQIRRRLYYAKTPRGLRKNQQTFMELTGNKKQLRREPHLYGGKVRVSELLRKSGGALLAGGPRHEAERGRAERILEVLVATLSQEARRG